MSSKVKMKVGSYYYNKHAGVLRCIKRENELYEVSNKCFMYVVNELGEICTLLTSRNYNLEYECDVCGNKVHVEPQTTSSKIDLELKIDTTDAILSIKKLSSEFEKMKTELQESEPQFEVGDKVIYENNGELQLGYVGGFLLDSYLVVSSGHDYSQGTICKAEDVYDYESLSKYETQHGTVVVIDEEENDNYLCLIIGKDNEKYFNFLHKDWLIHQKAFEDYSEVTNNNESRKHSHYFKDVSNLDEIDVYAVLTLFEVTDPCIAHAVKKLLCTGNRGHKDFETDVQDAIDSLVRWKELNQDLTK